MPSASAFGALFKIGIQAEFMIRLRENVCSDISSLHHQMAELNTILLKLFHPPRISTAATWGTAALVSAVRIFLVVAIHHQPNMAVNAESFFHFLHSCATAAS